MLKAENVAKKCSKDCLGYATTRRPRCGVGSLRCYEALRRSVGHLVVEYLRQSLLDFFVAFSALVLSSIVSFLFILISPCSMKHYSIGD